MNEAQAVIFVVAVVGCVIVLAVVGTSLLNRHVDGGEIDLGQAAEPFISISGPRVEAHTRATVSLEEAFAATFNAFFQRFEPPAHDGSAEEGVAI